MTQTERWRVKPDGAAWGEFGARDQTGRMNLLGGDKLIAAAREIVAGVNFCLSLPLDYPGGSVLSHRRHPPVLRPTLRNGLPNWNYDFSRDDARRRDLVCDDAAVLHTHYSTHWDALCHVGQLFDADGDGVEEPVYYNGFRGGADIVGPDRAEDAGSVGVFEAISTVGANALGIDRMAATCVQGRGVMVDLEHHYGRERTLIGYDKLMRVLDSDRVVVEEADMVCLRTGFADVLLGMGKTPDGDVLARSCAALDGRDDRLLNWITDVRLSALIADNFAVEGLPASPAVACCTGIPLHRHCLFKLGVHLGELWHLSELAAWLRAHGRHRFFLTAPPLRLPGASGSPVTPVATV
jgi:kynurenine formamidase